MFAEQSQGPYWGWQGGHGHPAEPKMQVDGDCRGHEQDLPTSPGGNTVPAPGTLRPGSPITPGSRGDQGGQPETSHAVLMATKAAVYGMNQMDRHLSQTTAD